MQRFRFHPPAVAISPSLRWVLLRAFAPSDTELTGPGEPEEAYRTALTMDLCARLAGRTDGAELVRVLGRELTARFVAEQMATRARVDTALAVARRIAEIAETEAIPVAFIKGVALVLADWVDPDWRDVSDVDVLTAETDGERLVRRLVQTGFQPHPAADPEHQHFPLLLEPCGGGAVEVHRFLLGVRMDGSSWADHGSLMARSLLIVTNALPGMVTVPARDVLVAHALVHGVAQHGLFPGGYPMMRMIGDLIDLGFGGDDGPWLADRALAWIRDDVNREEVEAVRRLCARLALGDGSMFESRDSSRDEIRLLRHIVAGAEDESYRRSLKLRALFVGPRPARGLRGRLHTIRRAVFVGPAQVDLIYGRPRSRLAYAWRRLARPFDLMLRSLRAVWHGLEVRLRR